MRSFNATQLFIIGFVVQSLLMFVCFRHFRSSLNLKNGKQVISDGALKNYDESLSEFLYNEVKVLCMVMTYPATHKTKAVHVKNTWGRRCNKLLFMSSETDNDLDIVVLPVENSRAALWNKTKAGFEHVYANYIDEYDFFLKADDDTYVIVENLRYLLSQYNPKTALLFGYRFAVDGVDEGYMAGGGYVLSRKAVKKFIENIVFDERLCSSTGAAEDLELGICLAHSAIFVDGRDELHQERFYPLGMEEQMKIVEADDNYWFADRKYYHSTEGNISCCSDTSVQFHYLEAQELYALEYFIYKVHPFGIVEHLDETLLRKLSLDEIIKASDVQSTSNQYKKHKYFHNIDTAEIY